VETNLLEGATMQVSPYLNFNGQCEEAFKFYEKALGARIDTMLTHEGVPTAQIVPPDWRKKILHARLTIGDRILSGADAPADYYEVPKGFSVMLQLNNDAEAERVFALLAEGGQVQVPIQPTFWATRFGMAVDRFGVPWMINCSQAV
jgi:PhnB protein